MGNFQDIGVDEEVDEDKLAEGVRLVAVETFIQAATYAGAAASYLKQSQAMMETVSRLMPFLTKEQLKALYFGDSTLLEVLSGKNFKLPSSSQIMDGIVRKYMEAIGGQSEEKEQASSRPDEQDGGSLHERGSDSGKRIWED